MALFQFTTKILAGVAALTDDVACKPDTPIEEGIKNFIDCYRGYYQV